MNDDIIERAKQALEGVTQGRWETRSDYNEPTRVVHSGEAEWSLFVCCDCQVEAGAINDADATFVSAARSLVPALVAELEAAREELAENEGVMRALRRQRDTAETKLDAIRELANNPIEVELGAEMVPAVDILAILESPRSQCLRCGDTEPHQCARPKENR